MTNTPLSLFEAFGVELEYMIVAADSLSVRPVADELLRAVAGSYEPEVELGEIAWSNELALHLIELKTNGPRASLEELPQAFQQQVTRINDLLRPLAAQLMPTAMHPWMNPHTELRLWPHEYNAVYDAFNRIFDCRGHGWANLQSVHLNLPFGDDEQFGRLHAAIRLLLPILPALAASSPVVESKLTGWMDTRLEVYRSNAASIPSVSGRVIPEPVYTRNDYLQTVLEPMYQDIAPHDRERILQHEWLNARGAIARFERNTIEIRVLDVQECPQADLAICAAAVGVLRALVEQRWSAIDEQQSVPVEPLAELLLRNMRDAERSVIDDRDYLQLFGLQSSRPCTGGQLWRYLIEQTGDLLPGGGARWQEPLELILTQGPLARRIVNRLDRPLTESSLQNVYRRLCDCLSRGEMFQ
jgi:gamma-glutamyl:cysteine ligase YbdK (ATP-grasp superfamily)